MNYLLYVIAPCSAVAALFYGWLKFLNWRAAKPKRIPRHVVRAILKGPLVLALLACFLPVSCKNLTPAQQAALTTAGDRILTKALAVGEAKLDKALGLAPAAVVVPTPAPMGPPAPVTPGK